MTEPARKTGISWQRPVLLIVCTAILAACAVPEPESPEPGYPQRIVSLVPAATEILFAIGVGDRVVGISDYDSYPPEALDRPRVGALTTANMESIFGLEPDLVITYGTQTLLEDRLDVAGIRYMEFETGPTRHFLETIRRFGSELGVEAGAERLASDIAETLDRLRESRPAEPQSVLLVHSRDVGTLGGFYTGGGQSYFTELIDIVGGRNIFADVEQNAFQPTLEAVVERGPDIIVEIVPGDGGGMEAMARRRADWNALSSAPAVRDGRVYVLAGDHHMLMGPRLIESVEELAGVVRPQQSSDLPDGLPGPN